jgi:hypothetical protein
VAECAMMLVSSANRLPTSPPLRRTCLPRLSSWYRRASGERATCAACTTLMSEAMLLLRVCTRKLGVAGAARPARGRI